MSATHYTITDASDTDVNDIVSIADQQLGQGYLTPELTLTFLQPPNRCRIIYNQDKQTIAFCIILLLKASEISTRLGLTTHPLLPAEGMVGVIKTIAVAGPHQGKGIGRVLVQDAVQFLAGMRVKVFLCPTWKHNETVGLGNILEQSGFHTLEVIHRYWEKDSLERKYTCPACGAPPCTCTAVIYARLP
ncbi:MAG: GNAT family N-acetyltransferase [Flavobacteriales bacterium]|nr:GNAT family N-acetyltransferase [Flavobacteriales bacterium]MCB9448285.1 GNAT family N-acetyltransferase [Flavobacteriales bacterium]